MRLSPIALPTALIMMFLMESAAWAQQEVPDAAMTTALARIRDAGLNDDWAYRRLGCHAGAGHLGASSGGA